MSRYNRTLVTVGIVILVALFGSMGMGTGKAVAEPLTYNFTYTSADTVKSSAVWDTVQFGSLLKNTGSQADTYDVYLAENSPTPNAWWSRFCAGGICWDSTVTHAISYLEPTWTDSIILDVIPRTSGQGNYTITVVSRGNPGLKMTKSITFLLYAPQIPVTNEWGLIILILLIFASGVYLAVRKYRMARQT